jgi:predicted transcriptional regulator
VGGHAPTEGLAGLRERAALPEILFLYECATLEPSRLRTVAERLGLTVQAASHTFRELKRRGLAEVRDGRYRPTIAGVARLHGALDGLSADVRERIDRLHVIRSTRALAAGPLAVGDSVALEMRAGILTAERSRAGGSRGTVVRGGPAGALAEIGELTGIVAIRPAEITVRTIAEADLDSGDLTSRVRAALPGTADLVAAVGLEASHAVLGATGRPVVRYAAGAACLEAARVGVGATVFVLERDLPHLLGAFAVPAPPQLKVLPLASGRRTPAARARAAAPRGR